MLINSNDIENHIHVSDPQVSPDGKWIAVVKIERSIQNNETYKNVFITNNDGTEIIQITTVGTTNIFPRWCPNGKHLSFVSNRNGNFQIYLINIDGGEARQITDMPHGVSGAPTWSPDGKQISFSAKALPFIEEFRQNNSQDSSDIPYVIDTIPIHLAKVQNNLYLHIFVKSIKFENPASNMSDVIQVSEGERNFSSPIWSNVSNIIFSIVSSNPT